MKKTLVYISLAMSLMACQKSEQQSQDKSQLSKEIKENPDYDFVEKKGLKVLSTGFNAGDGYGEVWVRDFNTFITHSLKVIDQQEVRRNLLTFFRIQGDDGNIADGFVIVPKGKPYDSLYYHKKAGVEGIVFHKNTVETDQESSLIQSVYKYIQATGDRSILTEQIEGQTLLERMESAVNFLLTSRFSEQYGLLTGATTSDWGDVQPEHDWGVEIDENTHFSIDIYDNAMFLIALQNLSEMETAAPKIAQWQKLHRQIAKATMAQLWDEKAQKFIPHLYLDGSPFPEDFNENEIYYHGGTAVAIEAGLLTKEQVLAAYHKMQENVKASGAPSIGLTMYPTYPEGYFKNKGMYPYGYQNGGDWTWFGARMVIQLVKYGYVNEAVEALEPMVKRVKENNGFYEWYSVDNKPSGSGTFRGSAGVLMTAIDALRLWGGDETQHFLTK